METSKYKNLAEWRKAEPLAYAAASKKNLLDIICEKYVWKKNKSSGYWTLERCKEDALKYKTKTEWQKNSSGYHAARTNKWHYECCAHMQNIIKSDGYWTLERCKEDALKYETKSEWQKNSGSAYGAACKNKWHYECCAHMISISLPKGYWTLEHCKEDALKYKTRSEWQKKSGSAYYSMCKNKWLDECCTHMTSICKSDGYWTLEHCREEALKYNTKSEWQKKSRNSSNSSAYKNGWIEECCAHMKK